MRCWVWNTYVSANFITFVVLSKLSTVCPLAASANHVSTRLEPWNHFHIRLDPQDLSGSSMAPYLLGIALADGAIQAWFQLLFPNALRRPYIRVDIPNGFAWWLKSGPKKKHRINQNNINYPPPLPIIPGLSLDSAATTAAPAQMPKQ